MDIPPGKVGRRHFDDMVEMVYRGVPEERKSEYERDQDFGEVLQGGNNP